MSYYGYGRRSSSWLLLILAALIVFGCCATQFVPAKLAVGEVEGTVVDKYVKRYNDSDYFHVAVQKVDDSIEVLQNRDSIWWGKFNSADMQQALQVGKHYRLTVVGWRIPFLSAFRNIVEVNSQKLSN